MDPQCNCSIIKVNILDDDRSYREALKDLLLENKSIRIYGEYSAGVPFLTDLEHTPFKPDVCLIDYMLPDISGIDCCKRIKELGLNIHLILMTAHPCFETISSAEELGLDYIEKGTLGEILIEKIVSSTDDIRSDRFLSLKQEDKQINNSLFYELKEIQKRVGTLSRTQRMVLKKRQENKTLKEIALDMKISVQTVKTHLDRASKKLNLPDIIDFLDL